MLMIACRFHFFTKLIDPKSLCTNPIRDYSSMVGLITPPIKGGRSIPIGVNKFSKSYHTQKKKKEKRKVEHNIKQRYWGY